MLIDVMSVLSDYFLFLFLFLVRLFAFPCLGYFLGHKPDSEVPPTFRMINHNSDSETRQFPSILFECSRSPRTPIISQNTGRTDPPNPSRSRLITTDSQPPSSPCPCRLRAPTAPTSAPSHMPALLSIRTRTSITHPEPEAVRKLKLSVPKEEEGG